MGRDGWGKIRGLDAFARSKVPDDLRHQTVIGGGISLISFTVMLVLFISELKSFLTLQRTTDLSVDNSNSKFLRVHIDIDLPNLNCEVLGVDAADVSGNAQLEITTHMYKTPIDRDGFPKGKALRMLARKRHANPTPSPPPMPGCGSCMGAGGEGECCNTCESVRKAYERRGWMLVDLTLVPQCVREGITSFTAGKYDPEHGCNIRGYVEVLKVAGTLRITPGHTFMYMGRAMHDLSAMRNHEINLSHKFNSVSFGRPFPGQTNALDGVKQVVSGQRNALGQHEYFLKVVPTTYKRQWRRTLSTNQYSVTQFFRKIPAGESALPGIFLFYDMSPIKVEVTESRPSFFHFIVQLCAIIGGVYTVSSLLSVFLDDVVLRAIRKRNTGKLI